MKIDYRLKTVDYRLTVERLFTGYSRAPHWRCLSLRSKVYGLKSNKGFTLIELMLVVIIIGALSAMVLPRMVGRSEQARMSATRADIKANIATALKLYELDNGTFPTTDEGLEALLSQPSSTRDTNKGQALL